MPPSTPRFTIFILLRALPAWLSLPRAQRSAIATEALSVALAEAPVTLRHYDAEAFSAFCSDLSVFETDDLGAFYFVMERLRDTPIFAVPYFDLIQILPAIEDGYRHFEATAA
jgi:hypothetical protein